MAMEKVTFGDDMPGYDFGPKDGPAVVVIQEWWGVTDEVKAQAMCLSKRGGYRVLIPDFYKGKLSADAAEAAHNLDNLDWGASVGQLKSAVDYLKSTGSTKVGVTGFCMGGALAFVAAQYADVACAAPFYGIPQAQLCQVEKITVPVLMQFGKADNHAGFSDPETAQKTADAMRAAGRDVTLHLYEGVGHAYMNGFTSQAIERMNEAKLPRPANLAEIQELSWQRLMDFFEKSLK